MNTMSLSEKMSIEDLGDADTYDMSESAAYEAAYADAVAAGFVGTLVEYIADCQAKADAVLGQFESGEEEFPF